MRYLPRLTNGGLAQIRPNRRLSALSNEAVARQPDERRAACGDLVPIADCRQRPTKQPKVCQVLLAEWVSICGGTIAASYPAQHSFERALAEAA